jgi:type IX secretion system substrate protein/copper-binding protein NosD
MKRKTFNYLNFRTIIVLFFCIIIFKTSYTQQEKWIMPVQVHPTITLNEVPVIDFVSGSPVFTTETLNNFASWQTVAYGQYCNNCTDEPGELSSFYITGAKLLKFPSGTATVLDDFHPLMASWEAVCGNHVQEAIEVAPSTYLSQESLAEVAVGEGVEPATFWIVAQKSNSTLVGGSSGGGGSNAHQGEDYYVYLMDFNNSAFSQTSLTAEAAIDMPAGTNRSYNEGVALGPVFTYTGSTVTGIYGHYCRSIYIASYDEDVSGANGGYLYHFILDINTETLYFSDRIRSVSTTNRLMELELSFPHTSTSPHPRWLGAIGWSGTLLIELDENGMFNTTDGVMTINTDAKYGCEFERMNNYFYYSISSGIKRYTLSNYPTVTGIEDITTTTIGNAHMETAVNNKIYVLYTASGGSHFMELSDVSSGTPSITSDISYDLSNFYSSPPSASEANMGSAFPDWVDGERPGEITMPSIEICLDVYDCSYGEPITVQILHNNVLLHTLTITPGDCESVPVCPDITYEINVNNGEFVDYEYVIQDLSKTYTVGNVNGVGPGGQVITDIDITEDEVWTGLIFVNEDITVRNGAVLDISNTDVVFAECTGITLEDSAVLRANNSVFRTCDVNSVWDGITFTSGAYGIINENTFKNAMVGLYFRSSLKNVAEARITNNLFTNNKAGIGIGGGPFNEAITGNTFTIEESNINYLYACNPDILFVNSTNNSHWGILAVEEAVIKGSIAHNDFINNRETGNYKDFTGVYCSATGGASINDNNFTDMLSSIVVEMRSSHIFIENNNILVSNNYLPDNNQIKVTMSNYVKILNNTIINTFDSYQQEEPGPINFYNNNAIYVEGEERTYSIIEVRNNDIKGFESGIFARFITSSNIVGNIINDAYFYGIYAQDLSDVSISCNEIDLNWSYSNLCIGIGYFEHFENRICEIRGNCVFNTTYALYLYGELFTIPIVKNNYLYNYKQFGLYNNGFVGNIGTGLTGQAAGKNTFTDNSFGVALDISTTIPMTVYGCWGVSSTSAGVTLVGNNAYNSTASCGHQIETQTPVITDEEECKKNHHGGIKDLTGFETEYELMNLMNSCNSIESVKDAYSTIMSEGYNSRTMQWVDYKYHYLLDDFDAAYNALNEIIPSGNIEKDMWLIENVLLTLSTKQEVSESDIYRLMEISADTGNTYSDIANDLLRSLITNQNYNFKTKLIPDNEEFNKVSYEDCMVRTFPNPSSGKIAIQIQNLITDNSTIEVYNSIGKTVLSSKITSQSFNIDLSHCQPGIYLLKTNIAGETEIKKLIIR